MSLISEEQKRTGSPLPLNSLLVLNVLKHNHRMALAEISEECAVPDAKLKATLERLMESGLVDAMGNGRGRAYVLSAKAYKNPIHHVRQTDIDAVRYKELILTLARRKEFIADRVLLMNQGKLLFASDADTFLLGCGANTLEEAYLRRLHGL